MNTPTTKKATDKKATPAKSAPAKKTADATPTKKAAADKPIKAKSDAAKNLRDLFEDELKDIYWAENALVKALPKMAKNATSPTLKKAIEGHLEETKGQVERLKAVFKSIGVKAEAVKCDAMAGLLEEATGIMEETEPGAVRDAGIISAAQKVEHYEIATYGTLCVFAATLGEKDAHDLLGETLNQEKNCDLKLTEIAESSINEKAE